MAEIVFTWRCPQCRKSLLRAVAGGKGKLWLCQRCGYSGPRHLPPPTQQPPDPAA